MPGHLARLRDVPAKRGCRKKDAICVDVASAGCDAPIGRRARTGARVDVPLWALEELRGPYCIACVQALQHEVEAYITATCCGVPLRKRRFASLRCAHS